MQLGKKKPMESAVASGGGISFARKQDNDQVKSLNAKKLDIDFGGDDFFNSFQPAAAQEPQPLFGQSMGIQKPAKSNKLKEIDSDPFKIGSAASASQSNSMYLGGDSNAMNEKQAQERLQALAGRKAISSADFENYETPAMQQKF